MTARGRHRRNRPGRLSRASLTVTAGGAGLALPMVGAGTGAVQAATEEAWDKAASCESSGNRRTDTGNGHFGGLQFTQSTWAAYGGTAYGPRADPATRAGRVPVAEKEPEGLGPGARPTCGPRAGLGGSGRTGNAPGTAGSAGTSAAGAGDASHAGNAGNTGNTGKAERAAKARADRQRQAASYEVVSGDSLSSIASTHEVDGGWQALYERNRRAVGGDPDLIFPGQRLSLDGPAAKPAPRPEGPQRRGTGNPGSAPDTDTKPEPEPGSEAEQRAGQRERDAEKRRQEGAARADAQKRRDAGERKAAAPGAIAPVSGVSPSTAYRASGGSWSSGHHTGVDFPVSTGTTVRSVAGGSVVSAGWAGAYGYQVVVRHDDGRYSQYAHLSAISVRSGQQVNTGQRLGRSGSTGNSTGPHLHFEVRTGPGYGSDIDPLGYLRGRGVRI